MGPDLAKGKVTAKDDQPRCAEYIRDRQKEWRAAVRSRAVGQDEAIATRSRRTVQESAHGDLTRVIIQEFSIFAHPIGDSGADGPMKATMPAMVIGGQ